VTAISLDDRLTFAVDLARRAGEFALSRFRAIDTLVIESKGHQDLVSDADRATETLIRDAIAARWPDDGIVGEEHGRKYGTTGFDWVIDPIDGTANFVRGIPHWCVVIACTKDGLPVVGAIHDPSTGELFQAAKGAGAFVNGRRLKAAQGGSLRDGSVATGVSGRTDPAKASTLVHEVLAPGGMFFRSASGALMLAYVASGRLLGYVEDHMNSWDCFAALLMVEEAGGRILPLDAGRALENGTRVVAGGPNIYPTLDGITTRVFG
jgi:myo-inositol-1(or 4)-monophosphatase